FRLGEIGGESACRIGIARPGIDRGECGAELCGLQCREPEPQGDEVPSKLVAWREIGRGEFRSAHGCLPAWDLTEGGIVGMAPPPCGRVRGRANRTSYLSVSPGRLS